ncbi:Necrosis inducing [Moelleriella libera RCEF 2490]|uniref:Necrosis inducing n=1 Tax=Moelleriella libera RCEF 2490 TaxID=1081109 RepID=A0A162IB93_9HYPO|nr:Necrosis inducing [Moelleriella libera RCEF 2490]
MLASIALATFLSPWLLAAAAFPQNHNKTKNYLKQINDLFIQYIDYYNKHRPNITTLPLPANASEEELLFEPRVRFTKDSCFNMAAIDKHGEPNWGLTSKYASLTKGCRDDRVLEQNNVYSRRRCNNLWCAYVYSYYFQKDIAIPHFPGPWAGHRHDWEHVILWVHDKDRVASYVTHSYHDKWTTTFARTKYYENYDKWSWDPVSNGKLVGYHGWPDIALLQKLEKMYQGYSKYPIVTDSAFPVALRIAKDHVMSVIKRHDECDCAEWSVSAFPPPPLHLLPVNAV